MSRTLTGAGMAFALGSGCGDSELLDTGDILVLTLEPSSVYVDESGGDVSVGCTDRGGANVRVLGVRSDGTSAEKVDVQLWLSGTAVGSLSTNHVTLNEEGTNVDACILPGRVPGATVLHARSGAFETTTELSVMARTVPAAGSLVVSVSPVAAMSTAMASVCGAPAPNACFPGRGRRASIAIQGLGGETRAVPEGASVILSTDFGWLAENDCLGIDPYAGLNLRLSADTAHAFACFPDFGGSGTLSVRSGSLTSTAPLRVAPLVQSLSLVTSRVEARPDDDISLTTFVSDCAGEGVADVPIVLRVTSGAFDFGTAGPVLRTGADGLVTVVGRSPRLPLTLDAQVLGTPAVSCKVTISAMDHEKDAGP